MSFVSVSRDADTKNAVILIPLNIQGTRISRKRAKRPHCHASTSLSHLQAHSKDNRASMEPRRKWVEGAVDIFKRSEISDVEGQPAIDNVKGNDEYWVRDQGKEEGKSRVEAPLRLDFEWIAYNRYTMMTVERSRVATPCGKVSAVESGRIEGQGVMSKNGTRGNVLALQIAQAGVGFEQGMLRS